MNGAIDYGSMMHRAMQGLIAEVLAQVAANGLPGDHHFYITFDTTEDGVEMADWLRERYPSEMMIVIQHWYENLTVAEDHFAVTLNFGNSPEPMVIPFDAVRTFVDPSVEFGLRFETQDSAGDTIEAEEAPALEGSPSEPVAEDGGEAGHSADVVSLDKWRK
ncbi:MAG: ClpXP protease specificity-enhancing factor SspB [Paracoccus sp. (in: a-proteobacteria)]|nr:ClpXP protease specificity-enhancing factor SspB [Paracoccus sp. (in: a-proteobacteria)]